MELTKEQKNVLEAKGHLLVEGGPGSGKTTVSSLKAAELVAIELGPSQQILFLSFARVTIARILEAMRTELHLSSDVLKRIRVDTYHAFFWNMLKTHGYLLGLPAGLTILTPADEAVLLATIRSNSETKDDELLQQIQAEMHRSAFEEGKISFGLFASLVAQLLEQSAKIRDLVANAYPTILLDEFQDTDDDEWRVVKQLGINSRIIALADNEQRIYDFRGANPQRIDHLREAFAPEEVSLGASNHRSGHKDIDKFANDMVAENFTQPVYDGIQVKTFPNNQAQAYLELVGVVLAARDRVMKNNPSDWSLGVFVPTKLMTRTVSDYFRENHGRLPAIPHQAVVEMEGAILGAEVITFFLDSSVERSMARFITLMQNYLKGRLGDKTNIGGVNDAEAIEKASIRVGIARENGKPDPKKSIFLPLEQTYTLIMDYVMTGDPDMDWRAIAGILSDTESKLILKLAEDVKNLRILDRGGQLRLQLTNAWRENGSYKGALETVRQTFADDFFARSVKPEKGVVVMNMHKVKGKQFDEVVIFEGWPRTRDKKTNVGRIVRGNEENNINDQCKYNLKVSVTRARSMATIMTPQIDPCVLLVKK